MVALAVVRPMQPLSLSPQFGHRDACHSPASHNGIAFFSKDRWNTPTSTFTSASRTCLDRPLDRLPRTRIQHSGGLRTPPPDRRPHETLTSMQPLTHGPVLRQFEPPIMSNSNVPSSLDSFRPSQRSSTYHPHQVSDIPQPRRNSLHINTSICSHYTSAPTDLFQQGPNPQVMSEKKPKKTVRVKRNSSVSNGSGVTVEIPPVVNGQRISLPEFAAQIVCFLWFESSYLLHRVEESKAIPVVQAPLARDAVPSVAFRRWLATILSTTQVSDNVVLLALLFVYRLKKLNPTVKGKTGSEFRLITIALMLGNKYLDDNTYTNKTWAEVSGISVGEVHVMEVEFLQNMKYNLYASETQWADWHSKLGKFWQYWNTASQTIFNISPRSPAPVSPLSTTMQPTLPSPPRSKVPSPATVGTGHSPTPAYPHQILGPSVADGLGSNSRMLDHGAPAPIIRKRSYDGMGAAPVEPSAKRVTRSMAPNIAVTIPQYPIQVPPPLTGIPRAADRNPSRDSAGRTMTLPIPSMPSTGFEFNLPDPGSKAMSMVYPNHIAHGLPASAALSSSVMVPPPVTLQPRPSSSYEQNASSSSSPSVAYPNPQSQHLSPSYFLDNRSSPYRPVRGVSTLLISQTQAPVPPAMNADQIQYQPLTKGRHQYRNGVLPYSHTELSWGPSQRVPQ